MYCTIHMRTKFIIYLKQFVFIFVPLENKTLLRFFFFFDCACSFVFLLSSINMKWHLIFNAGHILKDVAKKKHTHKKKKEKKQK